MYVKNNIKLHFMLLSIVDAQGTEQKAFTIERCPLYRGSNGLESIKLS